ncbi:MAG: purine phosphorylase [Gammaproteobacteria bacterium]
MSDFLGVVAALNAEAQCLYRPTPEAGILLGISGMGPDLARQAAARLVQEGVKALASWGIAAGLAEGLRAGSLVLPHCVVTGRAQITVDEHWHQRLFSRLIESLPVHSGAIAHTPIALSSRAQKASLHAETDAMAADMESMAVAQVARKAGLPFVAIRAIADPCDLTLPHCALNAVDDAGQSKLTKLLPGLARSPLDLVPLIALGIAFHKALTTLRYVSKYAGPLLMASVSATLAQLVPSARPIGERFSESETST